MFDDIIGIYDDNRIPALVLTNFGELAHWNIWVNSDFKFHNTNWRGSSKMDPPGRAAKLFVVINDLSNIIHKPIFLSSIL